MDLYLLQVTLRYTQSSITHICNSMEFQFLQVLLWSVIHFPQWWSWCWQLQGCGKSTVDAIHPHTTIAYWCLWYNWVSRWIIHKQGTGEENKDMSMVHLITRHDMLCFIHHLYVTATHKNFIMHRVFHITILKTCVQFMTCHLHFVNYFNIKT